MDQCPPVNTTTADATPPLSTPAPATPLLADHERQRCEIWTRVMGYHRPVSSFNVGKQGEFAERCFFRESRMPVDRA